MPYAPSAHKQVKNHVLYILMVKGEILKKSIYRVGRSLYYMVQLIGKCICQNKVIILVKADYYRPIVVRDSIWECVTDPVLEVATLRVATTVLYMLELTVKTHPSSASMK